MNENNLLGKLRIALINSRKLKLNQNLKVLQLILGECATQMGRTGKECTDEQVEKIIRGIKDKNSETLSLLIGKNRPEDEKVLKEENVYLEAWLPKTLSLQEITRILRENEHIIIGQKEGAAIGCAMKFMKANGYKVLGEDVKVGVQIVLLQREAASAIGV